MSFSGLTPEALVQRSDSKNPATTCQGLTTNGTRCRRSLGSTPGNSPGPSPAKGSNVAGVVAILTEDNAAAFFCWQHQNQAQNLVARLQQDQRRTTIVPLQKRSSIDTLAEKVGILNLEDEVEVARPSISRPSIQRRQVLGQDGMGRLDAVNDISAERRRVKKRDTLPQEWQHMQGPLMSVPEEVLQEALPERVEYQPKPRPSQRPQTSKYRRSNVKASWACCIRADNDYNDDGPPARRRERRTHQVENPRPTPYQDRRTSHTPKAATAAVDNTSTKLKVSRTPQMQHQQPQIELTNPQTPSRPPPQPLSSSTNSPPHTQTQSFLSIIPSNLDPSTTSLILSELSKPMPVDDEPGYIYIFWLTPSSDPSKPDEDIASTLLDDDTLSYQKDPGSLYPDLSDYGSRRPSNGISPSRRKNDLTQQALARFASIKRSNHRDQDRILLKIGRAQNVHRRMTQWTKQCNQNITLIRYYPIPTSAAADLNSPGGMKVPHVVRVERLIHLELRGLGMGKKNIEKCVECGREHREWFEVPATRDGLRLVDGVVRRWVEWGENAG